MTANHVLVMDLTTLSLRMHALGRDATARRSYVEGAAYRAAANMLRAELGLPRLDYDGDERP